MTEKIHDNLQANKFLIENLREEVKKRGNLQVSLDNDGLRNIFSAQAEADESGDMPVLLPGFNMEIQDGELSFYAPYTIDEDKKFVSYSGKAVNDENGDLIDTVPMKVEPESLRKRTEEAFEGKLNLPNFIKLITEDALKGEVLVERIYINGDKLGMDLKKTN